MKRRKWNEKERQRRGLTPEEMLEAVHNNPQVMNELSPRLTKYIVQVPTPKQQAFLLLMGREAFYGGAAGSGKSSVLLMAALQYVDVPGYNALLIRDSYPNLSKPGGLIARSHEWLRNTDAHWSGEHKQWRFPSGATLSFGYLDGPMDHFKYQSSEFQYVGIDEAVQIREDQALYVAFSRCRRLANSNVPIRFRAGSNPPAPEQIERGAWVKKRYVNPKTRKKGAVYIPAKLSDNPFLDQDEYTKSLYHLDHVLRSQLLEGDWEIQARGFMFDRKWFERISSFHIPQMGLTCRGWDLAATEEVSSALTAGIKIKRCEGIFYILHGLWFKGTPGVVDRKVVLTAEADGIGCIIGLPQDPGQAGIFQKRHFYSLLAGFTVRCTPESGSKVERASAISSQAEAGNVKIVEGPYVDVLLDELELFPHGEFLDRTDALSRAYHTLVSGSNKRMSAPTGIKNVHPDGTIYGQRVDNSISRNDRLIQMTR